MLPEPCHSRPCFRRGKLQRESKRKEFSMFQLGYYHLFHPTPKYAWHKVRILRETDKAILIDNGMEIWIPKSQIGVIRLKNNVFEIYVKEGMLA